MSEAETSGFSGLLALHQRLLRRPDAGSVSGLLPATARRSAADLHPSLAALAPYRPVEDADLRPLLDAQDLDDLTDASLDAVLLTLVRSEGPIHLDVLMARLLAQVSQSRSSARLRQQLRSRLQTLSDHGERLRVEGEFAALTRQWQTPPYRDWRNQTERLRRLEHVHDRELMQALWRVVDEGQDLEIDRALNDGLHRIGFVRLTSKARQRLAAPLAALLETKFLIDREGTLRLGPESFRR